ncbi:MAG: TIM44-like domain-containing protein [Gemmatimonadaceae bacterium]|nr:TIM44-like domain-containing protein [Acetobacteraceae bacterium]
MLFGGGMFGGAGGLGALGFISLLIQAALLFFVVRWLVRMVMRRNQPALAGGPADNNQQRTQQQGTQRGLFQGGGGAASRRPVQIAQADYEAFDRTLHGVQRAWSDQDLNAVHTVATPEMATYFGEQFAEQTSRGVRNTVTDVKLEQGDLAEAWSEGAREYATVAMRFSMLDVTRDSAGRVVEGDVATRSMATELWTFVRPQGGQWLLSAIQQTR